MGTLADAFAEIDARRAPTANEWATQRGAEYDATQAHAAHLAMDALKDALAVAHPRPEEQDARGLWLTGPWTCACGATLGDDATRRSNAYDAHLDALALGEGSP